MQRTKGTPDATRSRDQKPSKAASPSYAPVSAAPCATSQRAPTVSGSPAAAAGATLANAASKRMKRPLPRHDPEKGRSPMRIEMQKIHYRVIEICAWPGATAALADFLSACLSAKHQPCVRRATRLRHGAHLAKHRLAFTPPKPKLLDSAARNGRPSAGAPPTITWAMPGKSAGSGFSRLMVGGST